MPTLYTFAEELQYHLWANLIKLAKQTLVQLVTQSSNLLYCIIVRNKKVTPKLLVMLLNIIIEVCNNYLLRPGKYANNFKLHKKYEKYDCET